MVNNGGMNEQKVESLWVHLHWLTVLSQQGSYTAAAQRLGVSKAAMSQRISELERAAGVALVQRTTRSVRLTEAGRQLVDGMRDPFERIAQSFSSVRDLADEPAGLVRVTAPVAFARQQLVPRIAGFVRAHPKVRLELDMSDRLSALATEGFDLAIRHTASPPDTHVAWPLCGTRSLLVASRDYLRRRGTPRAPEDLFQHDLVGDDRQTDIRRGFAAMGYAVGREQFAVRPDDLNAYQAAVGAGLGVGFLPRYAARRNPDLVSLLPMLAIPPLPVWLAVHREIRSNPRIRQVWDFLAQAMPPALA